MVRSQLQFQKRVSISEILMYYGYARAICRAKLTCGLLLMLPLCLFPTPALSEMVPTGNHLVRFVCADYYHYVIILEQTSSKRLNTENYSPYARSDTIDGTVLIDGDHEIFFTDDASFRMRIYKGVRLISRLYDKNGDSNLLEYVYGGDRQRFLDGVRIVRQTSLSMGNTDEELIAELMRSEASLDSGGRRMDYTGVGVRLDTRFAFGAEVPLAGGGHFVKGLHIFLDDNSGELDTNLGASNSLEDGRYYCKEPVLIPEMIERRSGCTEEVQGPVDISVLAKDRALLRRIQRALSDRGFDPGPADGVLGPRTHSALAAWRNSQANYSAEILSHEELCTLLPEVVPVVRTVRGPE